MLATSACLPLCWILIKLWIFANTENSEQWVSPDSRAGLYYNVTSLPHTGTFLQTFCQHLVCRYCADTVCILCVYCVYIVPPPATTCCINCAPTNVIKCEAPSALLHPGTELGTTKFRHRDVGSWWWRLWWWIHQAFSAERWSLRCFCEWLSTFCARAIMRKVVVVAACVVVLWHSVTGSSGAQPSWSLETPPFCHII